MTILTSICDWVFSQSQDCSLFILCTDIFAILIPFWRPVLWFVFIYCEDGLWISCFGRFTDCQWIRWSESGHFGLDSIENIHQLW